MTINHDMKHQAPEDPNMGKEIFGLQTEDAQTQQLPEANAVFVDHVQSKDPASETAWYRRHNVQGAIAGGAAILIGAAAFVATRGGDNEPDRKTVAVAQPSTTSTPSLSATQQATETTPVTTPSPTDIPSTPVETATASATTPEATGNSELETESFVTAAQIKELINKDAVEKAIETYPVLETYMNPNFIPEQYADYITPDTIADYQSLIKQVYSAPDLAPTSPTPTFFDEQSFAKKPLDDFMLGLNTEAVVKFGYEMTNLADIFMPSGATAAHVDQFADLSSLSPIGRENLREKLKERVANNEVLAMSPVDNITVLGTGKDKDTGLTLVVSKYDFGKKATYLEWSVLVPVGDFHPAMPRGLKTEVSVPFFTTPIVKGQTKP
jgi:hypothetical protein